VGFNAAGLVDAAEYCQAEMPATAGPDAGGPATTCLKVRIEGRES
jgi:hypothetical protein